MRRKRVVGIGAVVVLVAAVGSVALLARSGSDRSGVEVSTPKVARNVAAQASIALPSGWQELPIVATTDPDEVLVVGTTARPDDEPIGGCDASQSAAPGSAFVSVYEYATSATLNSPDHRSIYDATQFISRPADFSTVAPAGPLPCAGTQPGDQPPAEVPLTSHSTAAQDSQPSTVAPTPRGDRIADFTFLESGRFFVARVVAADDARYRESIAVLNTLDIAVPPEVTTTTNAATPTPTTVVPADVQADARQAITDAIRGAFGGGGPRTSDQAVTGGFPLGEASKAAAKVGYENFIGVIVPRIDWLTLDTPTHATVNFDLLIDGQTITANTTGEAIFLDNMWKITAETFCTIVRRGGVTCPAP